MNLNLSGRVAIVTGASRGIGRAVALRLASSGAQVVAVARSASANDTAEAITATGGEAVAFAADVTRPADVHAMTSAALERFGHLDILVSNAGITRDQLLLRMKREDWDAVLETNLTAAYTCTQAVLKPMVKQRRGRLIFMSSVVGQMGNAGQANYAASKAGLIGFAKSVARELGPRNVTANVVAPGVIETDMTRALPDEAQQRWIDQVPLGRVGTVEEVASAVCFLSSDEAAYITGQVLAVNGGMYT